MSQRNTSISIAKGIAIILMVVGHAECPGALMSLIYLFHMPLFIFVSGRFSHVKDTKSFNRSIFKLLETLIIFQIIRSFVIPFIWGDNMKIVGQL